MTHYFKLFYLKIFIKYQIFIILFLVGNLFSRSGFGYTIGVYSGGEFTLPAENDYVEWIDYNPFFNGSLDYIKNDLGISIGGRIILGNLMHNGVEENNDNDLWSRFICFEYHDLLRNFEIIEKIKIFNYLKFSSSIIYSIDRYGWLNKKTTNSLGAPLSANLITSEIWEPFISYEVFKGSYTSHFGFGISLFLATHD